MSLHDILARPVQIMKEILDLEPDLESPSLASQFVAIKHQLAEIQNRLKESNRISHEKDIVIAKMQKAMAAKAPPRPTAPAFVRQQDDKPVQAPPVREPGQAKGLQAEPDEEIRLPAAPSYEAATQQARSVRPRPAARMTLSPAPGAAEPKLSTQATTRAKAKRARPTRTRVAAKKTSAATPTAAKPKKTARASKPAMAKKAKPKKTAQAGKSAPTAKAKPARTRTTTKKATAKTRAKATAKPKRSARASKK